MLNDPPVLIFLIVVMCFSFAVAIAAIPHLKRNRSARAVFVLFLLFGLFIGYGLHIQRDGFAVFAKQ